MKNSATQLKKGDTVAVLAGKDKTKTGKVIEVDRKANKIVVEGVNILHRFQKRSGNQPGQKLAFPAKMPASKAMLVCPHCGKATRIGHKTLENGKRQRICKKCNTAI